MTGVPSLGISSGGIGARSAQEQAPAADAASVSARAELSKRIWPAFDEYDLDSGSLLSDAEFELRSAIRLRFAGKPNRNPGAGVWLTSLPKSSDTHLPPPPSLHS